MNRQPNFNHKQGKNPQFEERKVQRNIATPLQPIRKAIKPIPADKEEAKEVPIAHQAVLNPRRIQSGKPNGSSQSAAALQEEYWKLKKRTQENQKKIDDLTTQMEENRQLIIRLRNEQRELKRRNEMASQDGVINISEEDLENLFAQQGPDVLAQLMNLRGLMARNEENMTYEQLLALEERIGNVPVGLNEDQMRELPVVPLTAENMCSICLVNMEKGEMAKLLPKCNHSYHAECIDQWLKAKKTCPLCLTEVI
ncbi:unnamed protein product [Blepharisma stoltei]|uniref:RING-type domain-containing protein n=1 Tax=Blepharisma stoltei TaxID=1481888 RepID=A0AAU9JEP4_9CILI|nr:unnamed protein product [Blepharisma stoltei]